MSDSPLAPAAADRCGASRLRTKSKTLTLTWRSSSSFAEATSPLLRHEGWHRQDRQSQDLCHSSSSRCAVPIGIDPRESIQGTEKLPSIGMTYGCLKDVREILRSFAQSLCPTLPNQLFWLCPITVSSRRTPNTNFPLRYPMRAALQSWLS